jgi:hypothetical protein
MPKIFVLSDYPIYSDVNKVASGMKPDHILYGLNYFSSRGWDLEFLPFNQSKFISKLSSIYKKTKFPIPLGNLEQQISLFEHLNQASLVFDITHHQSYLLGYLKALGFLQVPLACLVHGRLNFGSLAPIRHPFVKMAAQGVDIFSCLCQEAVDEVKKYIDEPSKATLVQWGPDINFYPHASPVGKGVIASGLTGRDFTTFGLAASQSKSEAYILCSQKNISKGFSSFSDNVKVITDYLDTAAYINALSIARAIAIPVVSNVVSMVGNTGLMDALGLGKPVIMTKHSLVDIDIEAEGIGIWVAPGDVNGWREAIDFFEDNPEKAIEMGKRAKQIAVETRNSKNFANQLMDAFEKVMKE